MHRPILFALLATVSIPAAAEVSKPAALTADGVPAVPDALAARSRPYMESRSAGFAGWNARDRSMLISTRFGNV
ncbi:MAG: S9 family peptidase, partial [Sphingomicrobium sp.]